MLRRIEALGYRCLRHVEVELDDFQILVGPNAAGKSTLLDAIVFLGEFITDGLNFPVERRSGVFRDLVWNRPVENPRFEIAVEVELPDAMRERLPDASAHDRLRYEVAARQDSQRLPYYIDHERWFPVTTSALPDRHAFRFPNPTTPPQTIFKQHGPERRQTTGGDSDWIGDRGATRPATNSDRDHWRASSALGFASRRSHPGTVPHWLDRELWDVVRVALFNPALRRPSPPQANVRLFNPFGCNLPWLVQFLKTECATAYREWLAHVQCVIPELTSVAVERAEDDHAYLVLDYGAGRREQSWTTSDGTLRLLALTLLAYLPKQPGRCIVEEPENGIHPLALDAVYDSLRSMYDSQVFVSTHSPTFVRRAKAQEILCFAKDETGATDIVRGDRHPRLRDWLDSADTSLVFAAGVFG